MHEYLDFSDAQIAARGDEMFNKLVQKAAAELVRSGMIGGSYDPSQFAWSAEPPDDGTCRECYTWRRYPPGQRHFGYVWFHTCHNPACNHAHHTEEVWMASA
jgi:hypothetical protein